MQQQNIFSPFQPTRTGAMALGGLVAFGLLILGGVYLTPRAHSPVVPAGIPRGVPERKLRFVTYDLARQSPAKDPMFNAISRLDADYILLQGVNEDDAVEIAEMTGMQHSFHPQLYQRSERLAGRKGTWGNLILSRLPMYEGSPLGGIRGGYGESAVSVVEGRAFYIANLRLSPGDAASGEAGEFASTVKALGKPPMVVAVLLADAKPPAELGILNSVPGNGEWFYVSSDWQVIGTGTAPNAGTGLAPTWIDLVAKGATPATGPSR